MKKISVLFLTGIFVLVFNGLSFGGETYTYTTTAFSYPSGLAHDHAYSWKIDLSSKGYDSNTKTIDSVKLVFNNIWENTGDGDILQISVLDSDDAGNGIVSYNDYENPSNYFTATSFRTHEPYFKDDDNDGSTADLLFTLKNVSSNTENKITVTYSDGGSDITLVGDQSVPWSTSSNVIDVLTNYISGNILTLGLDPDCHYYASSISLILTTNSLTTGGGDPSHAPEPGTLVLFGLGLLGASGFGRKRFSSMG